MSVKTLAEREIIYLIQGIEESGDFLVHIVRDEWGTFQTVKIIDKNVMVEA